MQCLLIKCIFCTLLGVLLGHIVYKEELMMDPTKIASIMEENVSMLPGESLDVVVYS
jgi:hypothetical protein